MLTPEEITERMGAALGAVLAVVEAHERADHGGGRCAGTRASVLAWLAHHLDFTRRDLFPFLNHLDAYARDCARRGCASHDALPHEPPKGA